MKPHSAPPTNPAPHRERQMDEPRQAGEAEADDHGEQRADVELSLGADVEEADAEGERHGQPGQDERRRRDDRLRERPERAS